MTVALSQDTYDAMLDDLKKLRKVREDYIKMNAYAISRNLELVDEIKKYKKKAQAFDEVFNCAGGNSMDVGDYVNTIVDEYYEEEQ